MKFVIDNEEYLDLEEVLRITGLKQANLYIKMRYNDFPKCKKKKVELKFLRSRALWKKSEIEEYIESSKKKGEK